MEIINTENELIHDTIRKKCIEYNISIAKFGRMAGINSHTLAGWKSKNPSTIQLLMQVEETFKKLEDGKIN